MADSGKSVVALTADMIFAARIRGAAPNVILARDAKDLLAKVAESKPDLVVLDMDRRGLNVRATVEQLKAAGVEVLCYVSHVREDLISEAREAGADKVMARGAFANHIAELLR
jgi:DNA-binding NarL/FixJ family response regulator